MAATTYSVGSSLTLSGSQVVAILNSLVGIQGTVSKLTIKMPPRSPLPHLAQKEKQKIKLGFSLLCLDTKHSIDLFIKIQYFLSDSG